ncbi:hypothetical protein FXO37_31788 [Capsicum annuum]|nr:hypothetical protein FXO37_31788 [Capsicum annuum]
MKAAIASTKLEQKVEAKRNVLPRKAAGQTWKILLLQSGQRLRVYLKQPLYLARRFDMLNDYYLLTDSVDSNRKCKRYLNFEEEWKNLYEAFGGLLVIGFVRISRVSHLPDQQKEKK